MVEGEYRFVCIMAFVVIIDASHSPSYLIDALCIQTYVVATYNASPEIALPFDAFSKVKQSFVIVIIVNKAWHNYFVN